MMNIGNEKGLGLVIHSVQHALITAYENCPLRPVKTGRSSLKWTAELGSLGRGVRRLFNHSRRDQNPHSWELYRDAQRKYRKKVRRTSKETWMTCSSNNDLPSSARLNMDLSRDPKFRLGSLVAPSVRRTHSKGETLDFLLHMHFPNSVAMEKGVAPATVGRAKRLDWQVATKVVTYGKAVWAIDSFAPYNSPGMDGIFPALLQEGWEVLVPYLVRIFRACLGTGYVPATWRQVKVVFIPKPGRYSYSGHKDYSSLSPTPFFLKTAEKLIDF
jgi:hypothetical protein